MSLPIHSPLTTSRPTTLAEAVEQSRFPRNHATFRLVSHRDELLRLRQAGESVETLAAGLRLVGVEIGRETLRRWLQRELGRQPAKRRRGKGRRTAGVDPSGRATLAAADQSSADLPTETPAPRSDTELAGDHVPEPEVSGLIRPGETPMQALQRRVAELRMRKAAEWPPDIMPLGGQEDKLITPPA